MCDNNYMSVQPPKPLTVPENTTPKVIEESTGGIGFVRPRSKKPIANQNQSTKTSTERVATVKSKLHVQDLMKQYKINDISLDELSKAFINDVQWDVRGITGNEIEGGNTWFVVYSAIDDKFTSEDFVKVAQDYEDADLKKSLGEKR
jgi:hypothetical protein